MQSLGYSFIYTVKLTNPKTCIRQQTIFGMVFFCTQHHISRQQEAGTVDDLRHQPLSVALPPLLDMAEAARYAFKRRNRVVYVKQVHKSPYDCRTRRRRVRFTSTGSRDIGVVSCEPSQLHTALKLPPATKGDRPDKMLPAQASLHLA